MTTLRLASSGRLTSIGPATLAALLAATCLADLQAQAPARLGRPDAVLARPLASIRGLRELSDGRVLVTDWIEERILLVDARLASAVPVGRTGAGPMEFRLPAALLPYRDDSTLLVDVGNARLAVLDPAGRVARTIAADRSGLGSPGGTDSSGAIYYTVPPWAREDAASSPDSTPVMRFHPGTGGAERVAAVRGMTLRTDRKPRRTPGLPFVPFAPQDAWRVDPSGILVVVRAGTYAVERVENGRVTRGPAHTYDVDPVRAADRKAFVADFIARSPMSGRGPGGGMGHSPTPSDDDIEQMVRTNEFADRLPFFDPSGVFLAPDRELWVLRGRHAGQPAVYDRFESSGRREGQVELGAARVIVGVGRRHVYVAATDNDGLQTLERYRRPAAGR